MAENAYAYLGKAMATVKVGTPVQPTKDEILDLVKEKNYKRARKFAGPALEAVLSSWESLLEGEEEN